MRNAAFLFLWLIAAAPAGADSLYKCVGKGGQITIQQTACPAGTKTGKTIAYTPGPQTVPVPVRALRSSSVYYAGTPYVAATPDQTARRRCDDAKAWAEAERRLLGLHITYDQIEWINDRVYEECKSVSR